MVSADIEMLIGMTQFDPCMACQDNDLDYIQIRSESYANPIILVLSEKLDFENTDEDIERNVMASNLVDIHIGIGTVKKCRHLSFEEK